MQFDITFCVADCTNTLCELNINFVDIPVGREVSQADFSEDCDKYEPYGKLPRDSNTYEELNFNEDC